MRRYASLLAVVASVSACAPTVNVEQEKAALLAADKEWSATPPDIDKWASYLAPDATFAMSGGPAMRGTKAIKDGLAPMMKAPGFAVSWQPTRAEVGAAGDLGYTAGTFKLTINNAAGLPSTETGNYITVWKKINGAWKALEDGGGPDAPSPISSPHVMKTSSDITWGDAPPSVPKGAKLAVVSGDPGKPEPFTIRLQMPAGYKVAPHWHPTDEHMTVLSGTLAVGMGKAWDDTALKDLGAGGYATLPATMPHFATAKTAATIQVQGIGPFVLNYVNPADDPSKK